MKTLSTLWLDTYRFRTIVLNKLLRKDVFATKEERKGKGYLLCW